MNFTMHKKFNKCENYSDNIQKAYECGTYFSTKYMLCALKKNSLTESYILFVYTYGICTYLYLCIYKRLAVLSSKYSWSYRSCEHQYRNCSGLELILLK